MDGVAFDTLTRSLLARGSRRRALIGLASTLGLILGATAIEDATAKKKCPPCKKRKQGKCKGKKPDGTVCPGGTCQGGRCTPVRCPTGQKPCAGRCIPSNQCCTNSDCPALRPSCQQGSCICPPERPLLCAGSNDCRQCCTVTDCRPADWMDGQACQNGQCVCTVSGTRRCPAGTARPGACGFCCSNSECQGAEVCLLDFIDQPPQCNCVAGGGAVCNGVCASCPGMCNQPCPPGVEPGEFCCSGSDPLLCFPSQGGGGFCDVA
jgi:hypothetical protein